MSVHSEQLAPVPEQLLRTVNCPMILVLKNRIFEMILLYILSFQQDDTNHFWKNGSKGHFNIQYLPCPHVQPA